MRTPQYPLSTMLHHALLNKEMQLVYQPKYDVSAQCIVGAEALLRWANPIHGLLMPDSFIRLAERNGTIVALGEWVIEEACRQIAAWHAQGIAHFGVAVNVSARQLLGNRLFCAVRDATLRHGIDPQLLTLEITETSAMRDLAESLVVLRKLVGVGVRVSIDDFGTGYSSLMYLKQLPAVELKIDKGFMADDCSNDSTIIAAIVALGRALKMRVVAEGVETPEQLALLTRLGCDLMQGYLFGRPVPPNDLMYIRARYGRPDAPNATDFHHSSPRHPVL